MILIVIPFSLCWLFSEYVVKLRILQRTCFHYFYRLLDFGVYIMRARCCVHQT